MLAGFLTTALEIVVILDVCGVIAYFVISGLIRIGKSSEDAQTPATPTIYASPYQPCPAAGPTLSPVPQFGPAANPGLSIYAGAPVQPKEEGQGFSITAGLKRRIASLRNKFTYGPGKGNQGVETQDLATDYGRLGRVLDSFREEI